MPPCARQRRQPHRLRRRPAAEAVPARAGRRAVARAGRARCRREPAPGRPGRGRRAQIEPCSRPRRSSRRAWRAFRARKGRPRPRRNEAEQAQQPRAEETAKDEPGDPAAADRQRGSLGALVRRSRDRIAQVNNSTACGLILDLTGRGEGVASYLRRRCHRTRPTRPGNRMCDVIRTRSAPCTRRTFRGAPTRDTRASPCAFCLGTTDGRKGRARPLDRDAVARSCRGGAVILRDGAVRGGNALTVDRWEAPRRRTRPRLETPLSRAATAGVRHGHERVTCCPQSGSGSRLAWCQTPPRKARASDRKCVRGRVRARGGSLGRRVRWRLRLRLAWAAFCPAGFCLAGFG